MEIRYAEPNDLPGIVDIINYYNANGISTFDSRQYSTKEKLSWFDQFDNSSPYKLIVARADTRISGYTSSIIYRDKEVFSRTIETGIYVHPEQSGMGIGSQLYEFLFQELSRHQLHRAVAGVALPNEASINLHKKFGFREIGKFDEYAYFKDRFISSIWLQREI